MTFVQNDRKITITIGATRKATIWKPETLLLSEFWARLGNAHRSTETLTQYRELPKSKQDELKDVGGFVAGTFKAEKRRACDVTGRDIITLDLDNIPAGQTDSILLRLDSLGVGYCVYSTRKHAPEAPRLRVLLPLSRTVTADEYEPIARKAGEIIGMDYCDKTTFEASRLMYFPSCCADSQYVYRYADKPLVDADGMLRMYADWRDVTSWAGMTEQAIPRGKHQKDPTEKAGAVGAFCRVYDVPGAIAAYLPDRYTDAGEGRYTFAGGSTAALCCMTGASSCSRIMRRIRRVASCAMPSTWCGCICSVTRTRTQSPIPRPTSCRVSCRCVSLRCRINR